MFYDGKPADLFRSISVDIIISDDNLIIIIDE